MVVESESMNGFSKFWKKFLRSKTPKEALFGETIDIS